MIPEITAALQTAKVLNDVVQAHRSMRNFNELASAVADVNAKLSAAWAAALLAQEQQLTLTQRVREQEKEITELKNWERERERYQLTEIAMGMFAYRLKLGVEASEPVHDLCANCFTKGEKAILQFQSFPEKTYDCHRCKSVMVVGGGTISFASLVR